MNYYIWIFFFGDLATANHWFCECTVLFHVISFRNKQPKKGCHWCYNCGCCSSFDCSNCISVPQRTWHRDCWDSGVSVVMLVPNQSQSCISVTCDALHTPQTWNCVKQSEDVTMRKKYLFISEKVCACVIKMTDNAIKSVVRTNLIFGFFFYCDNKILSLYLGHLYSCLESTH